MGFGKPAEQVTPPCLESHTAGGGEVLPVNATTWKLTIPSGTNHQYRLAQLDDYHNTPRRYFPWRPPVKVALQARLSSPKLAGTWGFGFWNDPFSLSIGLGGSQQRLPALPNTAWFFYASPENYLSLSDNLPANGLLSTTFRSPRIPSPLLGLALPFLPLAFIPAFSRLARRFSRRLIQQDACQLNTDVTRWHNYTLCWLNEHADFYLDGVLVFRTHITPHAPLGFVLWIDNQFASWNPAGKVSFGNLAFSQPAHLEIKDLTIQRGAL